MVLDDIDDHDGRRDKDHGDNHLDPLAHGHATQHGTNGAVQAMLPTRYQAMRPAPDVCPTCQLTCQLNQARDSGAVSLDGFT